jgi:hypothetical protein
MPCQRKTRPQASDLFSEAKIGWKGRFELLNSLFGDQRVLRLCHDTIFLAVSIIDRYVSKKAVPWKSLELCYGVCLLISSKYIERRDMIPTLQQKGWLLYGAVHQDVLLLERDILETLDYLVGRPLLTEFVWMELLGEERTKQTEDMVIYLCKLTLFDPGLIQIPSHIVARSAAAAARLALRLSPRPIPTTEVYYETVWRVLFRLFRGLERPPRELFAEYSRPENSSVALILHGCLLDFAAA